MANMTVSLSDQMQAWAEERAASGSYASVSDYIRDLIRADKERQERLDVLRTALIEGEKSGIDPRPIDEIFSDLIRS